MSVLVHKYGGSSLASVAAIKQVAKNLAELKKSGKKIIVVVSAMGNSTNDLVKLANEISKTPPRRELDMLLTTGERVTMSLLSMALNELGIPAISFTGSQAGIMTTGPHTDGEIKCVKPIRVEEEFNKGKIVVLAGFQGVNPETKEVTTLGRGGSDTTAVAFAAHFGGQCEIFKDVPGVCSGDPKIIDGVQPIAELNHRFLEEMCFWGAGVLHLKCAQLAAKESIPLKIAQTDKPDLGTSVKTESSCKDCFAVNTHRHVFELRVTSENWQSFFRSHELPIPRILQQDSQALWITDEPENLSTLKSIATNGSDVKLEDSELSSVTLSFSESLWTDQKRADALEKISDHCEPNVVIATDRSLTAVVPSSLRKPLAQIWHEWATS